MAIPHPCPADKKDSLILAALPGQWILVMSTYTCRAAVLHSVHVVFPGIQESARKGNEHRTQALFASDHADLMSQLKVLPRSMVFQTK